jgi:NAD(P)-dependent dehydrogenase (short-subunit alcohol dehydrogenase family)/acyl carrier protein
MATRADEEVIGLAHAPLWGLVRTAQAEHGEREILLVDLDDHHASQRALPSAVASGEPQLTLRNGTLLVPRLARAAPSADASTRPLHPEGTVLVTGGTGGLGALVARHLVAKHGVRHLLLTSRQGLSAPGAEALKRDLLAAGAQVTIAACDAADRAALERLCASVSADHPLTGVIHTAGVIDDGMLRTMTDEQPHRVLRPKVDGAIHLHELTRGLDLSAFVLFSSLSGVLGSPAQANYAAASAFLDALASKRRALGLAGLSLAWGPWAEAGMAARLSDADRERMRRQGVPLLPPQDGLALLDIALGRPDAFLVAARFDATRTSAKADAVPSMLQELIRAPAVSARPIGAGAGARPALKQRLVSMSEADRGRYVLDFVRTEVATALGLPTPEAIEPDRSLLELGVDSLIALDLKSRLGTATGLRVPDLLPLCWSSQHRSSMTCRSRELTSG